MVQGSPLQEYTTWGGNGFFFSDFPNASQAFCSIYVPVAEFDARSSFCADNFFLPGFLHNYVYFLQVAATVRCGRRRDSDHRPYELASPARGLRGAFFATCRFWKVKMRNVAVILVSAIGLAGCVSTSEMEVAPNVVMLKTDAGGALFAGP